MTSIRLRGKRISTKITVCVSNSRTTNERNRWASKTAGNDGSFELTNAAMAPAQTTAKTIRIMISSMEQQSFRNENESVALEKIALQALPAPAEDSGRSPRTETRPGRWIIERLSRDS